ncbi:uncharacterized protein AC631_04312 [Debaryomyces fabryi]|uniref:Uncharacterized protein n=1 Tax=Debaryomyces fabryi TaxID=58627 RepID=A0A0V1PUQ2_9ASCO|nr:uncharacterized protein AC631_04312 [Debaryomyces fabryi]KRZ99941.1 hypothetical protein AC631_04312 [Debaryomyces fabryi]CUM52542.1 unnamed protein product [Debaryomyces fabryi]
MISRFARIPARSLGIQKYRYASTNHSLSNLYKQISQHGQIDQSQLTKINDIVKNSQSNFEQNQKQEDIDSIHDLIKLVKSHGELKNIEKSDIINNLLSYGLKHDFSLYHTAKKIESHKWSSDALTSLIDSNPGRVDQSWDLYLRHGKDIENDTLYSKILEKLLLGEKIEISDNEFEIDIGKLAKSLALVDKLSSPEDSGQIENLLKGLIDLKVLSGLSLSGLKNGSIETKLMQMDLDSLSFLKIFSMIFYENPDILAKEALCKALTISHQLDENLVNEDNDIESKNFQMLRDEYSKISQVNEVEYSEFNHDSIIKLRKDLLSYIEENRLDMDKTPESILIRMKLIETYGMDTNDIKLALAKYHTYQTHEKFGIEFIQHKLIQSFCYQAIRESNEHYLKIAETLLTVENIPIKVLQCYILANSEFNIDKSLDVYNDYIQNVSQSINEHSGRSPSGLMTESLMLCNLYHNDREFAYLLFDKAVANGILSDEHEISIIKKLFKVYGDSFVEDNWDCAKPILKKYVLNSIRSL